MKAAASLLLGYWYYQNTAGASNENAYADAGQARAGMVQAKARPAVAVPRE